MRADQSHQRLTRNAERERDSRLRCDDPETDLADLRGDRGKIAGFKLACDHRAENRVEAGLELLRQARDLLRDIINADRRGRDKQPENREIEPARSPFNGIGRSERQVAQRQLVEIGSARAPALRQAIAFEKGNHRRKQRGAHRQRISDQQPVA